MYFKQVVMNLYLVGTLINSDWPSRMAYRAQFSLFQVLFLMK